MKNPLQNLPTELVLHIHSYHDTYRQEFQKKVLPTLQDTVRLKLIEKAFHFIYKVNVQEAYEFVMDDNQFNYELVQEDLTFRHFDQMWFMNMVRKNKCWNR